jgi:hypothetical protein
MAAKRPVGALDMRGADPRLVGVTGNGDLLGTYKARRGVASLFLSALSAKLLDQLREVHARSKVVLHAVGVGRCRPVGEERRRGGPSYGAPGFRRPNLAAPELRILPRREKRGGRPAPGAFLIA